MILLPAQELRRRKIYTR